MQHVTDGDRQRFEKARRHGRRYALRQDAVVATRYDAQRDSLELMLRGGDVRVVPRTRIRELDAIPAQRLCSVSVSPAGDAISWRAFDVDVQT